MVMSQTGNSYVQKCEIHDGSRVTCSSYVKKISLRLMGWQEQISDRFLELQRIEAMFVYENSKKKFAFIFFINFNILLYKF